MKKRIVSILLAVVMIASMLPMGAITAFADDRPSYSLTLTEDTTLQELKGDFDEVSIVLNGYTLSILGDVSLKCAYLYVNFGLNCGGTITFNNNTSETAFSVSGGLHVDNTTFSYCKGRLFSLNLRFLGAFTDCTFDHCTADTYGTVAYIDTDVGAPALVSFNYCRFSNIAIESDKSGIGGGAVYINDMAPGRSAWFSGCTVENCRINDVNGGSGGFLYINDKDANVIIRDSSFSRCVAPQNGGLACINKSGATLSISDTVISDCNAFTDSIVSKDTFGGAIYSLGNVSMENVRIERSYASKDGGAIYSTGAISMKNSTVTDCSAGRNGGAIYTTGKLNDLENSVITTCEAKTGWGGGIYISNTSALVNNFGETDKDKAIAEAAAVDETTNKPKHGYTVITDCSAQYGGGVYAADIDLLQNIIFADNRSTYDGGGMYNNTGNGAASTVNNCRFYRNKAGTESSKYTSGGLCAEDKNGWIKNCQFFENEAYSSGAELWSNTHIENCTFRTNFDTEGTAAINVSEPENCTFINMSEFNLDREQRAFVVDSIDDWDALRYMIEANKLNVMYPAEGDYSIFAVSNHGNEDYCFYSYDRVDGRKLQLQLPSDCTENLLTFTYDPETDAYIITDKSTGYMLTWEYTSQYDTCILALYGEVEDPLRQRWLFEKTDDGCCRIRSLISGYLHANTWRGEDNIEGAVIGLNSISDNDRIAAEYIYKFKLAPVSGEYQTLTLGNVPVDETPRVILKSDIISANPIGRWISDSDKTKAFTGIFDGDGHTVSLRLSGGYSNNAAFAFTNGAKIRNLTVNGYVKGNSGAGGIIGHAENTVADNCVNYADISGADYVGGIIGWAKNTTVSYCNSHGKITASNNNVGGIIGRGYNVTVFNCQNMSDITANTNIGGTVGRLTGGSIEICENYGNINGSQKTGGIVGCFDGEATFLNCLSCGEIKATDNYAGGIIGREGDEAAYQQSAPKATVYNCHNFGSVSAKSDVHALTGNSASGSVYGNCFYDKERSPADSNGIEFSGNAVDEYINKYIFDNYSASDGFAPLYYDENGILQFADKFTEDTPRLWEKGKQTHHYLAGDFEFEDRFTVLGDVHLYLLSGATLTAKKGITLEEGNTLSVYGSQDPEIAGRIIATAAADSGNAGIGGVQLERFISLDGTSGTSCGTLKLYGGSVSTSGRIGFGGGKGTDAYHSYYNGGNGGAGGELYAFGGIMIAEGADKAIGGGYAGSGSYNGVDGIATKIKDTAGNILYQMGESTDGLSEPAVLKTDTLFGTAKYVTLYAVSHEHTYKNVYDWSNGNAVCTAKQVCNSCSEEFGGHIGKTVTVNTTAEHSEKGSTVYTAIFENPFETQTKEVYTGDPFGHVWINAEYNRAGESTLKDEATCGANTVYYKICSVCDVISTTETWSKSGTATGAHNWQQFNNRQHKCTVCERIENHTDENSDNRCDICGYSFCPHENITVTSYDWDLSSETKSCTAHWICDDCKDEFSETSYELEFVDTDYGEDCTEFGHGYYIADFNAVDSASSETVTTVPGPHKSTKIDYDWNEAHTECTATEYCTACGSDLLTENAVITVKDNYPGKDCVTQGTMVLLATFAKLGSDTATVPGEYGPHSFSGGECTLCHMPADFTDYFFIKNIGSVTAEITWPDYEYDSGDKIHKLEYSIGSRNFFADFENSVSLKPGEICYFRGTNVDLDDDRIQCATEGASLAVGGDIGTLLNEKGNLAKYPDVAFAHLFDGLTALNDITDLTLCREDTVLGIGSFSYMFRGCTGLEALPMDFLPATTLAMSCYSFMFRGCTGLIMLPEDLLLATTLAESCYNGMFRDCTGLTMLPNDLLPATTLAEFCYYNMFRDCTGLKALPVGLLQATTLTESCYNGMFYGCTGLEALPENLLPATTLTESCYYGMFYGCTGLEALPENLLPAMSLAESCYSAMFRNCSGLLNAPELPAEKLCKTCYSYMFYGCKNLSRIKLGFDHWFYDSSTFNFLPAGLADGVTLYIYCPCELDTSLRNVDCIPEGISVIINPCTVSFDMQGHGTQIDGQIVGNGCKVTKPTDPTAEGYLFDGWYKDSACTEAWDFETDTVTENTILYAKWTTGFSGISLTLGSDISINFYMELSEDARQNGTMTFNIGGRIVTVDGKDAKYNETEKKYYFSAPLNVLEIAETVTATFSYNGINYVQKYSVDRYIETILNGKDKDGKDYSDEMKLLARKIANYGYYAQIYLESIHTNVHIVDPNTEPEKGYDRIEPFGGEFDINTQKAIEALKDYKVTVSGTSDNLSLYGSTVYFDSATALNYYVTVKNDIKPTAKAVNTVTGEEKQVEIKLYKGNIYIVSVKDITATELADDITVTINGEITLTGSVFAYCNSVVMAHSFEGATEKDTFAVNAMAAFYEYYKAACDYAKTQG